jgi:predicted HicB family RNase H-like nuclease
MVRIPRDVLDEAKANAEADDRTVNSYVVKAVREQNRREKAGKK